eukprot:gene11043-11198_t
MAMLLIALQQCQHLTALHLDGLGLQDDFLPVLSECTALVSLDLSSNPDVTGVGIKAVLPSLQRLQYLNLSFTAVDDQVLPALGRLALLQWLQLQGTNVSWRAPADVCAAPAGAGAEPTAAPSFKYMKLSNFASDLLRRPVSEDVALFNRNLTTLEGLRELQQLHVQRPVGVSAQASPGSVKLKKPPPKGPSSSCYDSSSKSCTAVSLQHLTTFDERYRYSTALLLQLRPPASAAAGDEAEVEAGAGAVPSSTAGSYQTSEAATAWVDLALIPEELRACGASVGRWR